jgi:signal transduction histidine kinase
VRLSTRLSLSYIGFVALLAVLVGALATIQVVRLAARTSTIPPQTAANGTEAMRLFWSYFFTGVGMAVLAAIALALLAGFWYARYLTRPLVRLSKELQVAAAGDFTHRLPVEGSDEFAVLAGSYNHLVERLAAAEAERSKVEQSRRDLVANISHDLRTPLTSIQGFTEAMADDSTPPDVRRRHAATVAERIGALNAMLGDLLELSRLQALPDIKRAPTDLPELLRQQIIGLMPEIEAAGLEIDVDLPDALGPVMVDQRLIGRAVQNLLVNAIRHSGGARRIEVTLDRNPAAGPGLAITIADDGQGIPAADLPMLFDRYYQGTSATNAARGTGLGLAIVRQIAEHHGGRITVRTAEGSGTSFTLWLPHLSG